MSQRISRHPTPTNKDKRPTLRERLAALRYIPPLLKLVWRTHRGLTLAMIALRFVRAVTPVLTLWVGKLIIDEIVIAQRLSGAGSSPGGIELNRLWKLVAMEIVIVVIGDAIARASSLVESLLGDLFSNYTSVRLMEHAATLDLYQFENPNFYDVLERARRQTTGRIGLLTQLLGMGQDAITLLSLGAAIFVFSPWLLLLLFVAVLPNFLGATHFAALEYSLLYKWTPERRWLDYLRFLGASDRTAKEVQMFGLAGWIIARYRTLSLRFYEANKRLSIRKGVVATLLSAVGTLGYYAAYVIIILRAVTGALSLGTLTFLAASFARSRDVIERLLLGASGIYSQGLYLKDLFDFFEMRPTIVSIEGAPKVPIPVREGFAFDNVGFRYPESERWAVRGVSFALNQGERVALVGENGAGKTTLTKLLARLYDPTEGRITLDGRDIREYDVASLRAAISVIFQDFVRYDLALDANIGVGEIAKVEAYLDAAAIEGKPLEASNNKQGIFARLAGKNGDAKKVGVDVITDLPVNLALDVPQAITTAAEKSLAATLLPRLPAGYRQMLGRRFDGGVDLSGGEWQKVALGRAYMRDAQLLILDEPTAALDARAEFEVFERFSELARGRMAILISHRFSTVRMADRIVVLKDGGIVEQGTHDELAAGEGVYAELFRLQAAGYK